MWSWLVSWIFGEDGKEDIARRLAEELFSARRSARDVEQSINQFTTQVDEMEASLAHLRQQRQRMLEEMESVLLATYDPLERMGEDASAIEDLRNDAIVFTTTQVGRMTEQLQSLDERLFAQQLQLRCLHAHHGVIQQHEIIADDVGYKEHGLMQDDVVHDDGARREVVQHEAEDETRAVEFPLHSTC